MSSNPPPFPFDPSRLGAPEKSITGASLIAQAIRDLGNINLFTAEEIGSIIYPRTAAEIAAGVTPTSYAYEPGYEGRFGMIADSTTDNTTALQNLLDGAAGSVPVRIRRLGSGYYKLTGRVTAPANTHIILEDGAELRWTATAATGSNLLGVATRPGIEVTGDNFRIEGSGVLKGPSSGAYVANEIGIFALGTSTSARKSGFVIGAGIEFTQWGYAGVVTQFVNYLNLDKLRIYGCGHAGYFGFSCDHGSALDVNIGDITPGTGGNAYGFSLTHDSTDYDIDANIATPRLVANPFCADWDISGTIYDVPLWQGFDAHGGYEIRVHHMATYNCRHGIAISSGSGDASAYAGENNSINHVVCTTNKRDGSATDVSATDRNGITIQGGTTVKHQNVRLSNFVLDGYGDTVVSSASVRAMNISGGHISHGTVLNWKGYGINTEDGNGTIDDVIFGAVASATNSICVYKNFSATAGRWDVYSCRHRANGGTVAGEGLRVTTGNGRYIGLGNDWSECTARFAGDATSLTMGSSDIVPTITATGTPTSVDVASVGDAPRVRIVFSCSGNSTVTDFPNAFVGQIIECYFPIAGGTAVTTVDRTNTVLAGGANFVSTQYDTLVLECVNTSGTKFVERSRSANS